MTLQVNNQRRVRQSGGAAVFVIGATLAISAVGDGRSSAAETAVTSPKGKLRINVVDTDGHELAGAKIQVAISTDEKKFDTNRDYACNERGSTLAELPGTLERLRVWARSPGFAPMVGELWPQSRSERSPLPDQFTFVLTKGSAIGGVVKDEDGQPVSGARVEVRYDAGGDDFGAPTVTKYDTWLAEGNLAPTSDAGGRWSLDNVPPGDRVKVQIKLSHSEYVSDGEWGGLQHEQNISTEQLRSQSATIVMRRGHRVTGRLTDQNGSPIPNAVILWTNTRWWQTGSQKVHNEEGKYHLEPLAAGPMRVTVAAEGWMPETREIEIGPTMADVDFQLQPGKKLRIKFVNAAGAPVPKVSVRINKWQGGELLYNFRPTNLVDLKIPNSADEEGIFEWAWAPDDAVEYTFSKQGFADTTVRIAADNVEHVQTVQPVLHFSGSVTDAATGKPIEEFRVVPVIHFTPDFPFLPRQNAEDGKGGHFSIHLDRTDIEHGVQIEAPGYVTFRTDRRYKVGEANPVLEVRLQPSERYLGTVIDVDGRPVGGARVYVATGFQNMDLSDLLNRTEEHSSNYGVTAHRDGTFEIVPQMERYALVVVSPAGFVEVDRAATQMPGKLHVRPWAKVSGHVVQEGKPIANCRVYLDPIRLSGGDVPRVNLRLSVLTGSDGSFAFDRVPPIACRIQPYLHFSSISPLNSSRSVPLDVAPGSETSVDLGAGGAEITGRFALDPPRAPFDYHFSLTYLVAKQPGINPPTSLAGMGFDWRRGWSDAWFQSQEGSAYLKTLHHWFVKPEPDGQFRISGVPPGKYELAVNLYGTTEEGCLVHPAAQRVAQIEVGTRHAEIDLGDVEIAAQAVPKVGDVAANFGFVAPDGTSTDLAAQRGKYVLIDFWATWCAPCLAKLTEVEALRKEFGTKGLVVVGASLDAEADAAQKFLAMNPIPWHHAFLGDWSSTEVPKRYGITSVPAYVIVDPDGRIIALEKSTDKLRERLASVDDLR